MNVLIIGSGGREHTIAWKLSQSKKTEKIFIAPGNAGTHLFCENVNISINNFEEIKSLVLKKNIEMVIVGPEEPLVNGIVDFFINDKTLQNIAIIGPNSLGAQLEGSKAFSKEFMEKYNIPTAKYGNFNIQNIDKAFAFLDSLKSPYVLKASGLAAGKGVLIIDDINKAKLSLKEMFDGKFGEASQTVVIEEFMKGIEVSYFVLTDSKNFVLLPEAKDYKRIGESDTGLNTGGMGAISPVPFANSEFTEKVISQIIKPTINGLISENIKYKGFLFIGLMNIDGNPKVVEYNVRLGDPETEAILPRINSDLLALFEATYNEKLNSFNLEISNKTAATVMLVSGGYPENYEKNKEITGLENITDSLVFHAGTSLINNKTVSSGGRVIAVTSLANTKAEALEKSFANCNKIKFEGKYYRKDIGFDL
jgi:phosphoribosylamine--glycine ligase